MADSKIIKDNTSKKNSRRNNESGRLVIFFEYFLEMRNNIDKLVNNVNFLSVDIGDLHHTINNLYKKIDYIDHEISILKQTTKCDPNTLNQIDIQIKDIQEKLKGFIMPIPDPKDIDSLQKDIKELKNRSRNIDQGITNMQGDITNIYQIIGTYLDKLDIFDDRFDELKPKIYNLSTRITFMNHDKLQLEEQKTDADNR